MYHKYKAIEGKVVLFFISLAYKSHDFYVSLFYY